MNPIRKGLVITVIVLIIGMIVPSTGFNVEKSTVYFDGNTLHVGGDGPGNYTKIQDAINDSSDGDTVFVYDDSSPYFESVIVNKPISLVGEDKNTTIIHNILFHHHAVELVNNHSLVREFTLKNGCGGTVFSGVYISSDFNIVRDCNIFDNQGSGITIMGRNNTILNNKIVRNHDYGIWIIGYPPSSNNMLYNNSIMFNGMDGIRFSDSSDCHDYNKIYHNDFIFNMRNNAGNYGNNSWDNGYPSGGNFWDDYTGIDNDGDGIGDTPYPVGSGKYDRFPFISPLKEYDEPLAYFTYEIEDLTVTFNGNLSFDMDGMITEWSWDFGDGNTGVGEKVIHTYQNYGFYNINLTVIDNDGKENIIVKEVEVEKFYKFVMFFLFGKIENLSLRVMYYSFNAVKIRAISFHPFNRAILKSGEEIHLSRGYYGKLNEKFVLAFGMATIIDERPAKEPYDIGV